jgi:dihydroneopterin aldolase
MKSYGQMLEEIEAMPEDQQESLVDTVCKRLAERRRAGLVKSVQAARKEFKSGKLRPATPSEIVRKVLA